MKFLAVSTNTADPSAFLDAEAIRVAELVRSGLVEQVFLKADYSGAVLVVEAPDRPTAEEAVTSLPLVVNGVTTFELTEILAPPAG